MTTPVGRIVGGFDAAQIVFTGDAPWSLVRYEAEIGVFRQEQYPDLVEALCAAFNRGLDAARVTEDGKRDGVLATVRAGAQQAQMTVDGAVCEALRASAAFWRVVAASVDGWTIVVRLPSQYEGIVSVELRM